MKRLIASAIGAALLLGVFAAPAAAATAQDYSFVVPRLGGSVYSSYKSVTAARHIDTYHRYSGGKTLYFTAMYSSASAAGSSIAVSPGGASAPRTTLWYNGTGVNKSILVRIKNSVLSAVDVLAQGTWYWNY